MRNFKFMNYALPQFLAGRGIAVYCSVSSQTPAYRIRMEGGRKPISADVNAAQLEMFVDAVRDCSSLRGVCAAYATAERYISTLQS